MNAAPRIASLVPSLTELLFALGLGPQVVARTGFCIHPADAVGRVPKVGGTKDVNLERLAALAPTHVLVNVDENRRETVEALRAWPAASRPELLVTHPCAPEDNLALITQVAEAFAGVPGVAARAGVLRAQLEAELAASESARGGFAAQRVLYLIWREPWMTVARDTYIARMLDSVGWQTLPTVDGGESGAARYPVLAGDEAWLLEVQQVLLSSEPYRFGAQHVAEAQRLCPAARVRLVDGERLSWYGARTADGLRYLRTLATA